MRFHLAQLVFPLAGQLGRAEGINAEIGNLLDQ